WSTAACFFALATAQRLRIECGPGWPAALPGPLCGGESGSTGRVAGVDRDVDSFSHGQDARSKSPAPAHGLAGQEARQAPSGVAFSFGYFSLGHAREK